MVLKDGLNYQQLLEYPNSDAEDNGSESFFNESISFSTEIEEASEQGEPLTPDDDLDMYLMSLTSPGLKTPQSSLRVSVVHPKPEPPVECASESMNSVETLVLNESREPSVEVLDMLQKGFVNVAHSPVLEEAKI